MRDLTRAREDMKGLQLKARQRLGAFLLRHGRVYEGKCRWTQAHSSWLEAQAFESPVQQVVFQEYVDAVTQAGARVASLEGRMHGALETWSLAPAVAGLRALRGVDTIVAMTVLAALGRSGALRVAAPVDEFSGTGAERAFLRIAPATGRDHQDRQRARAPGAGGGGVELPVPGAPDRAPEAQGRGGARGGARRWPGRRRSGCAPVTGICCMSARPGTRSPRRWRGSWRGSSGRSPARWPAARTPAGRSSERRAPRPARITGPNMRPSGRGRPVRRTLDRATRGGSADPSTRDSRPRQLRDEVKSGGNQPTHIRVIHRRPGAARGLNLIGRPNETTTVPAGP